MRTVQDLVDDLARVEGRLLDETVFEFFHRGPKALDKLLSYWEQRADDNLRRRIGASVLNQWNRIQEALVELPPTALGSPGVRFGLGLGPSGAIARRAQRCIEQGRIETAAGIAAVLAATERTGVDHAVLEARLAIAGGRPEEALSRLEPYLNPGPGFDEIAQWMSVASLASGARAEAMSLRLAAEPDAEFLARAMQGLICACERDELARCITEVARRGDLAGWRLMAEAAALAELEMERDAVELIGRLLGQADEIISRFWALDAAASDMEASPHEAAVRSMAREIGAIGEEARIFVNQVRSLIAALLSAEEAPADCDFGGFDAICTPDRLHEAASGDASRALDDHEPDSARLLRFAACVHGWAVKCAWRGGAYEFEVSRRQGQQTGPALHQPWTRTVDGAGDPDEIENMLKSLVPREAASALIEAVREGICSRTRPLLAAAEHMLEQVDIQLSELIAQACESAQPNPYLRGIIREVQRQLSEWPALCAAPQIGGGGSEEDGACLQPEADGHGRATEGVLSRDQEWTPPAGIDISSDSGQALCTAHRLVLAAQAGALPHEQASLAVFLLGKAVEIEAEPRLGEALATHKLRAVLLRESVERGKRKRELAPGVYARAMAVLSDSVSPDRIRGGLDRLASRVLDGGSKPVASEPLLAGLSLVCFDPLGDPGASAALGRALARFGVLSTAGISLPDSKNLSLIEEAALEALKQLGSRGAS
ncbi:MAG: hypothetical protein VB144_13425 [Clostridia bacterium]|nr:hypothetical protein [Clostridia bacterium]